MKQIKEIITNLSDVKNSLESALLKTKIIANHLEILEVEAWATNEIRGYEDIDTIPEYRTLECHFMGKFAGPILEGVEQLPASHLKEPLKSRFEKARLGEGIAVLEKTVLGNSSDNLNMYLTPVQVQLVSVNLKKYFNPSVQLVAAWQMITISQVQGVISSIRNKLLDFMLAIDKQYPDDNESSEINKEFLKEQAAKFLFRGGSHVFVLGNNSTTIDITVHQNDFGSLNDYLRSKGIDQKDIEELQHILFDEKNTAKETQTLGPKTRTWLKKISDKIIDSGVSSGMGYVIPEIAKAIGGYFGI